MPGVFVASLELTVRSNNSTFFKKKKQSFSFSVIACTY